MNRRLVSQLVILLILAAAQPLIWNRVTTSAEQLHSRRTQEQQLANLEERLAAITSDVAEKDPMIRQLDLIFPTGDAVPQLLERFEQLGVQNAVVVDIRNITEENPADQKGGVILVPFTVTAEARGSIDSIFRYLEALEHIPELVTVQQWSVAPIGDAENPAQTHQMNFSAVFYLQRDGERPTTIQ